MKIGSFSLEIVGGEVFDPSDITFSSKKGRILRAQLLDLSLRLRFRLKKAHFLMRFRLSSTLKRPKTLMKMEIFENGFKSGVLKMHRFENAPFRTGENGGF